MKAVLGIIFLAIYSVVFAQSPTDELLGFPELLPEELGEIVTDEYYRTYEPFSSAFRISVSRANSDYATGYLHLKKQSWQVRGGLRVEDFAAGNLQLMFRDKAQIGSFRPAWAAGLLLYRGPDAIGLLNPPNPQTYAPTGLGLNLQLGKLGILGSISQVDRAVILKEGRISQLPKSKRDYMNTSREQIGALGLYYNSQWISAGGLYYHQQYDTSFSNAETDSLLNAASAFLGLHTSKHRLMAELVFQDDEPSVKAEWEMNDGKVQNKWTYTKLKRYQRPAYAAKAMLISSLDCREELRAELRYHLCKTLNIAFGTVLNHRRGDVSDPTWLSHSSMKLSFRDSQSMLTGDIKLIDREILSLVDSTYVDSRPKHWRFALNGRYTLNSHWDIHVKARYHHQEQTTSLRSGSYWAQYIGYKHPAFKAKGGLAISSSANYKMMIYQDNDAGYELLGKNTVRAELQGTYQWKWLSLEARLYQDLTDTQDTALTLRLNGRFG